MQIQRARAHPFAFLTYGALVCVTIWLAFRSVAFQTSPDILSFAIAIDTLVILPAAYYVLIAYPRGWSPLSVAPIVIVAALTASWSIGERAPLVARASSVIIALAELAAIANVAQGARRAWRGYRRRSRLATPDVAGTVRDAFELAGEPRSVWRALATEILLPYYALVAWARRPEVTPEQQAFTHHRRHGYTALAVVLTMIVGVEILLTEILIAGRWPAVGIVLFVAGLYTLVFLAADLVAIIKRPTVVDGDGLHLRVGLRWTAFIAAHTIGDVTVGDRRDRSDAVLDVSVMRNPNATVELTEPTVIVGLYGLERRVTTIRLGVDDVEAFAAAIRSLIASR